MSERLHHTIDYTGNIIAESIKPNNTIVVIGPSVSMLQDATLLLCSQKVEETNGNLFVVDPESESRLPQRSYEEMVILSGGARTWGIGNIDQYLSEIQKLQTLGLKLRVPQWLGPDNFASTISLEDHSVDLILDHMTTPQFGGRNRKEAVQVYEKIYREYRRVLSSGGKLLLFTNDGMFEPGNTETIRTALNNCDFNTRRRSVEDTLEISIERDTFLYLKKYANYNYADELGERLLYFLYRRVVNVGDQYAIRFDSPTYPATELLSAVAM